jgi:A/G-specific adenine glycosylase
LTPDGRPSRFQQLTFDNWKSAIDNSLRMASRNSRNNRQSIAPDLRRRMRGRLLRWYDRHRRDLPWRRRSSDPYAQWVAEVMLQQTRVETVVGYYERFLKRFPTVESLARADHQTVLKHWEGLGYYRRIHHLHEAARGIAVNGRVMPQSADDLRKLKGVGAYTAAAIASIAYGEPVAAVDGNVARVLARLFAIREDVLSTTGKRRVQALADQLLSPKRPGDFNQAWMDLGSLICTPQSPACGRCPMNQECQAHERGLADKLPIRGGNRKQAASTVLLVVGIFSDGDRVLVRRRATGGLWSGLWEFPTHETAASDDVAPVIREWAHAIGPGRMQYEQRLGIVCHRLTHRRIVFDVHHVVTCREETRTDVPTTRSNPLRKTMEAPVEPVFNRSGDGLETLSGRLQRVRRPLGVAKWVRLAELRALPLSTAQRKVLLLAKPALERAALLNKRS